MSGKLTQLMEQTMHRLRENLGSTTYATVSVLFRAKAPGTSAPGGNRHRCSSISLAPADCRR